MREREFITLRPAAATAFGHMADIGDAAACSFEKSGTAVGAAQRWLFNPLVVAEQQQQKQIAYAIR